MRAIFRRALVVFLLALSKESLAQGIPTIDLESARLRLGMNEDELVAALGKSYQVTKETGDSGSSWLIWQGTGAQRNLVANAYLKGGILTTVLRYWGPDQQEAGVPLANAVYGLASQLVREGRRLCVLGVASNQTPQADMRTVVLDCSGKRLTVGITISSRYGNAASVNEEIGR